jgi:hypothetical protein
VSGLAAEVRASARMQGESRNEGGSNSVVESQPSKLLVAGSIPVSRSKFRASDRDRLVQATEFNKPM